MEKSKFNNHKKYHKPLLNSLLSTLKLDKAYIKAEQEYLYYQTDSTEIRVLDLAGGFGSLLLGHNNTELLTYAKELLDKKIPTHAQMSIRSGSMALSEKLNFLLKERSNKEYVSTILNTGTEAIEAAIKHALLNYNKKITAFKKRLEKELVTIENSYQKYGGRFEVHIHGTLFTSFPCFKKYMCDHYYDTIKRNRPKIYASKKSFHGKTMGSLSITSNESYRTPFGGFHQVETLFFDWDKQQVEECINSYDFDLLLPRINTKGEIIIKPIPLNSIAALFIEPILGEGGVHVVPFDFLRFLRAKTQSKNIILVFDEIQCGCFRTGTFLASFKSAVFADYYTIGKSLGGGLAKISALIIERTKYIEEFDLLHSSTFAEDDFSSCIAIKALEIMERHSLAAQQKGAYIVKNLQELKTTYKNVITEIRGDGLMIGISFRGFDLSQCSGFQGLSRSKYLGYVLVGYLLNKKNIRVSVTLSDPNTIRIHPSLFISDTSIQCFIAALDELCYILQCQDFYALIDFIVPLEQQNLRPVRHFNTPNVMVDPIEKAQSQVGFLVHFINSNSIEKSIPSFKDLPEEVILTIVRLLAPFAHPVLLGRNSIRSKNEESVGITFVGLPFTSKMVKDDMNDSLQKLQPYQKLCNHAIEVLYSNGVSKIGLGQYTSIIMQNGKAVTNANVKVTTGNGFTVFSTLSKVYAEIKRRDGQSDTLAIIGAGGNIATIISSLLVHKTSGILLMGRSERSKKKLIHQATLLLREIIEKIIPGNFTDSVPENLLLKSNLLAKIRKDATLLESDTLWELYIDEFQDQGPIQISWDLHRLKSFDIIVVATSDPNPFLDPRYFKDGSFICDVSVPLNCNEKLVSSTKKTVVRGGIIHLPKREKLYPKGFPLRKGQAFACMAETLFMGLEQDGSHFSFGELSESQVNAIGAIGSKHGFVQHEDICFYTAENTAF